MKLIAVVILVAVIIFVVIGYEFLMRLAKKGDKPINQDIVKVAEKVLQEQEKQLTKAIKTKINEINKPNSTKSKTKNKNGK